jgi:hypothetical protein
MRSKIQTEIRATVHTKEGKIIKRYPCLKNKSLLKQFTQLLMVQISQIAQTITDTSGTPNPFSPNAINLSSPGAIGDKTLGIQIGSDDTPVTMSDYVLGAPITTNVDYLLQSIAIQNPNASTWRISTARAFTNNTGSTLSIKEVGFIGLAVSTAYKFLLDRALYAVDVGDGLTVTFTFRLTITL